MVGGNHKFHAGVLLKGLLFYFLLVVVWVNDPTCTLLKCEGNRLFIFSSFSEVITIIRSKSGFFFLGGGG